MFYMRAFHLLSETGAAGQRKTSAFSQKPEEREPGIKSNHVEEDRRLRRSDATVGHRGAAADETGVKQPNLIDESSDLKAPMRRRPPM
jgi:hypothetical protein